MIKPKSADALVFEFQQSDYPQWLNEFAAVLGNNTTPQANGLYLNLGNGFSKAYNIEEGLSCALYDCTLSRSKTLIRHPGDSFGMIIYCCSFDTPEPYEYTLNGTVYKRAAGSYNLLRMVDAQAHHELKFAAGTRLTGISIYANRYWMEKNITAPLTSAVQQLQAATQLRGLMYAKQQKLVTEIVQVPDTHPYPMLYIKSRVLRLLDKIFEDFGNGVFNNLGEKLDEAEFELLQKVEMALVNHFPEPFPSIEKLSRIALMSESKLKRLFKLAYGMGMYEYFQKNRLHKAKQMLLSEKHSITEVGIMLGYQNLSNFSAAFKKEFNCLPSEIGRMN
ncbi:MAG TPA: AraC family transcriptional regulator [Ferruginibacter sp.]|nr:AraC family transcriptional regulator [Ferruginibacter sp.]HMP22211.1 AraC family transcriptional regulator [Ferruginibacter sp.]